MKTQELITDNAINIVFRNTNFGLTPHREVVETILLNVEKGYSIGYTAKCCLIELGLIREVSHGNFRITAIGDQYLEIIKTNKPVEPEHGDYHDKAKTVLMLLANAAGAEFEDEQLAVDILAENFKNL